jgi:hypothetical protein
MRQRWNGILLGIVLFAAAAGAQTTVTTSGGTANTVPVFTGSATLGNSPIAVSGSNVGIGITVPINPLEVIGDSGTSQSNIAVFQNGTNNAYTSITGVGTASQVGTWSNGSQLLEFVPYSTGNGIISAYSGNLLFQTNYRTTQMAITPAGNLGFGTISPGAKLEVNGNVKLTSGSGASVTFADGTVQSTAYTGVTCGGDYAESVDVTGDRTNYEPGDVMVIDSAAPGKFLKANEAYSTMVAGIYSTKPGVVGRRQTTDPKTSTTEVPMAMVGIVPTKVSAENGPIKVGDLLVASSTLGRAMKGTDRSQLTGAVIGKALGSLDSGTGVIEVLVTLQ